MALVGDVIAAARLEFPDPPQSLARPSMVALTAVAAGPIVTATLGAGGAGYAIGDTGFITTDSGDAMYVVTGVNSAGAVQTFGFLVLGTAYAVGGPKATAKGGPQPGVGAGLTINVTAIPAGWPNGTTLFCVATALNQWGETTPTGEVSQALATPNVMLDAEITVGPGATAVRLYFGTASDEEEQFIEIPVTGPGTFLINLPTSTPAGAEAGMPPVQNSAYLPDTDGSALAAKQVYAWLNDGLTELAAAAGGILDSTGMQGTVQNMYYVVPGKWYEITEIRWDNWPGFAAKRNEVFYRIVLSGVPTLFTEEGRSARQIIGSWPAPGASGNQTTLLGGAGGPGTPLGKTDTSMIVASGLNFTVQQRVLIDNEVILYGQVSQNPNGTTVLSGLIRWVGGTRAAVHQVGSVVTELKITVVGYRYSTQYMVGDGAVLLDIPPAWEIPIRQYMRYRYLKLEQDQEGAKDEYDQFKEAGKMLRIQRMGAVRSMQVGPPLMSEDPAGAWEGRILIP